MLAGPHIKGRVSTFALSLILLLISSFISITAAQDNDETPCMPCHEDIYTEVASTPYLHSIVAEDCGVCHITDDSGDIQEEVTTRTSEIDRELILALGELPEDFEYNLKVIARDNNDKESEPVIIKIAPKDVKWVAYPSIKKLSDVTVEEIKKGLYVQATISWETDVFASSAIEYISKGKYPDMLSRDDTFTKKHRVVLSGLKHKRTYRFSVLSRDLNGNVMKSDEYTLNTAEEFSNGNREDKGKSPLPNINHLAVFRVKKEDKENAKDDDKAEQNKEFYVMTNTNKPSTLTVSIKKSANPDNEIPDDKHGSGLAPARFSCMEVCYECHEQNASHPVGVKSEGIKTIVPDDLPTIEDGVLTCITCHYAHGGDKPYFARLDFNKELCVKCHIMGRYAR
jgi:predicted CXXCH cytochrome family protein